MRREELLKSYGNRRKKSKEEEEIFWENMKNWQKGLPESKKNCGKWLEKAGYLNHVKKWELQGILDGNSIK